MEGKTKDLISIVVPVYNGERFLQDTFDSIRNQTYKNYELIVADGASKDGTMNIIKSNLDIISTFISEPDSGMYDALEKGFGLSTGAYMCYINSDDRLAPDALELVYKAFKSSGGDLVFGHVNYISESGEVIYRYLSQNLPALAIRYMRRLPFAQQSTFWTRDLYNRIGGFDRSLKYVADSKFLITAYLDNKAKRSRVNAVLGEFRMHSDSLSIGSFEKMLKETDHLKANHPGLRDNRILMGVFEIANKLYNIRGVYKKLRYKGPKL